MRLKWSFIFFISTSGAFLWLRRTKGRMIRAPSNGATRRSACHSIRSIRKQFVEKDIPIPTPWDQAGYFKLEEERGKAIQAAKTEPERQSARQKYAKLLDEFFAKQT